MKVKKIVREKEVPENPLEITYSERFEESNNFLYNCRNYQYSIPQLRSFISQEFSRVFPNLPYPEGKPILLVRIAIAYELLIRCYKKKPALPAIPANVIQNHKAALAYDISGMDYSMRSIMEIQLKTTEGESDMKTKKAVLLKKAPKANPETEAAKKVKAKDSEKEPRVTVAGRYIDLFEQIANGKKITDKEIAATIKSEFGKAHTEARVNRYRSLYNTGSLAGQKFKAPVDRSEQYVAKAVKAVKATK